MFVAIGVGSIVATFGLLLYDIKNKKQGKNNKQKPNQIRLALTGGPCGGKSQGINMLYNTLKQITVPVFIVPEAATIIGSAGLQLDLSNCTPQEIQLFQIYLMKLQYNLEDLTCQIAKNFDRINKKSVLLCDRGMMDGKAYAGDQNWAIMLERVGITEQEILDRYEAVIHMVTAALGAQQSYNLSNNVRHQSVQRAIQLDFKIQKCYKDHPNKFVITNEVIVHNFQQKKRVLLAQVYQIILKIIETNLVDYYQDYFTVMRKGSEDDIENQISPYLMRKLRYKKFMKVRGSRANSPSK